MLWPNCMIQYTFSRKHSVIEQRSSNFNYKHLEELNNNGGTNNTTSKGRYTGGDRNANLRLTTNNDTEARRAKG